MKAKTNLSVLFVILLSVNVFSNRKSIINIKFTDQSKFCIELDNQKFRTPTKNLHLVDIIPGKHKIKAFKYRYNSPYPVLVYEGYIDIPTSSEVFIHFNRFNIPLISKIKPLHSNNGYMENSHYSQQYFHNSHNNNAHSISHNELRIILHNLKMMSFDSDRIKYAKEIVKHKPVTSKQVLSLIQTMNFESTRLKFAKYAYRFTIDKQNYSIVNEAFSFRSSTRELYRYLHS